MVESVDNDGKAPQPTQHIDQVISDSTRSVDKTVRKAELNSTEEWGTIGLPIFLTPEELEKLGVDPEKTDQALIRVRDGFLLIDSE